MMKQTRCYGCDKPIEPEWLPVGEFIVCDECSSDTDELSVEKIQEQLNTAKKHIEHVIGTIKHDGHLGTIQTDCILPYLEKTLAAIGAAMDNKRITEIVEEEMIKQDANRYRDMRKILTIPKSIADELEKYDFELTSKGLMYRNMGGTLVEFSRVIYDEIPQLIVQTIAGNYRIVFAYLAGEVLGVDLVKVVEG